MTVGEVIGAVRRECRGLLAVGERFDPLRYVLDPATGEPVMPVEADALDEDTLTLHVPDDSESHAVALLGEPREVDPKTSAACDRYRIYFGEPKTRKWLALRVDSIKTPAGVFDIADVPLGNPWHEREPGLCKALNADPARVAALARRATAGAAPEKPLVVGVDPMGIDIRGRFGIIRAEFAGVLALPEEVAAACTAMLAGDSRV